MARQFMYHMPVWKEVGSERHKKDLSGCGNMWGGTSRLL